MARAVWLVPAAAVVALLILAGWSEGADVMLSNQDYELDAEGTSITVSCEITGDLDNAYVEYSVCRGGVCGLAQEEPMEEDDPDVYQATIGPFETDDEVKFRVMAYDVQGDDEWTAWTTVNITGEGGGGKGTKTPGFEAFAVVLAFSLVAVVAMARRR